MSAVEKAKAQVQIRTAQLPMTLVFTPKVCSHCSMQIEKRQAETIPLLNRLPLTGLVKVCLDSKIHLLDTA